MGWSKLVDMELDDEAKIDTEMPILMADKPDYPYGLRICLTEKELKKLGLECDCDIGDLVDMRAFGVVTSVSKEKRSGEDCCRVEIQIQKIAIEDEMAEDMGDDE